MKIIIKADKTPAGEHKSRFNAPSTNEVSIVMVGTEYENRDIILDQRSAGLKRVSETHRWYDALQYPIIFWEGEDGYHFTMMQIDPKTRKTTTKKVKNLTYF